MLLKIDTWITEDGPKKGAWELTHNNDKKRIVLLAANVVNLENKDNKTYYGQTSLGNELYTQLVCKE